MSGITGHFGELLVLSLLLYFLKRLNYKEVEQMRNLKNLS